MFLYLQALWVVQCVCRQIDKVVFWIPSLFVYLLKSQGVELSGTLCTTAHKRTDERASVSPDSSNHIWLDKFNVHATECGMSHQEERGIMAYSKNRLYLNALTHFWHIPAASITTVNAAGAHWFLSDLPPESAGSISFTEHYPVSVRSLFSSLACNFTVLVHCHHCRHTVFGYCEQLFLIKQALKTSCQNSRQLQSATEAGKHGGEFSSYRATCECAETKNRSKKRQWWTHV